MPVVLSHDDEGNPKLVYKERFYGEMNEGFFARLLAFKKRYTRDREEMLTFKKACQKMGDIEGARFFREEAADCLKMQRAAAYWLGRYMEAPPGDCPNHPPCEWPIELAYHLDMAGYEAEGL